MKLALYHSPLSCAMVPYLSLTEAGAKFDTIALDFRRRASVIEYRELERTTAEQLALAA